MNVCACSIQEWDVKCTVVVRSGSRGGVLVDVAGIAVFGRVFRYTHPPPPGSLNVHAVLRDIVSNHSVLDLVVGATET